MQYRPDVDGLRAVAVSSVVLFHALPVLAPGGFVGVDVFFVISGFLVTRIVQDELAAGRFSILDFYERRARRILPALLVVIVATLVAASALYLPRHLTEVGAAAFWSLAFLANMYFLAEVDYFGAPEDTQPLLHLWSLGVEEQFYVLTPLLMLFAFRFGRRGVLVALVAATAVSFLAAAMVVGLHQKSAFYALPFRFWELGLGAILGVARIGVRGRAAHGVSLLGLGLIALAVFGYGPETRFPGPAALPPCLGAALLIAAGPGAAVNRALALRPLVATGLVSYSLYLWHWPVLSLAQYRMLRPPTPVEAALLVGLAAMLAVLSHRHVEAPFRRVRPGPGRTLPISAAALAACAAAALLLAQSDGFPGRWRSPSLALLEAEAAGRAPTRCRGRALAGETERSVCVLGGERPRFVLWGDSHAGALLPGAGLLAESTGVPGLVFRKNACPPLLGVDRADMPAWHACAAHNRKVVDEIRALRPEVVFLAARWALMATGGRAYGDEAHSGARFVHPGAASAEAAFGLAFAETVAALEETGARVVVVAGVPEIGWDVPTTLARAAEWGVPAPPAPSHAEFAARQAAVTVVLADLADRFGIEVIAPADILCDPGRRCRTLVGGMPVYADDDHLNAHGAALLEPLLAAALEAALEPPRLAGGT